MRKKEITVFKTFTTMKTRYINKLAIALGIAFSISSCNDDFLEQVNPNELSTSSFWKTKKDLDKGLIAVYSTLKHGNLIRIPDENIRTDLTYPGYGRPNPTNEYYLQQFNNSSDAPNSKWQFLYQGVFRANQVIIAGEKLRGTHGSEELEDAANIVIAEARALRGLFYFYLHNSFNKGSVVLIDFVSEKEEDFFLPLSEASVVEAFYLNDLEFAYNNLPDSWGDTDLGRMTSGAAAALIGKSHLYAGNYTEAQEWFGKVINDFNYSLTPNIGSNFTTYDEFNSESILELAYSLGYKDEIDPYSGEQISSTLNFAVSPVGGWRTMIPACWLTMAYKNDPIDASNTRNHVLNDDGTFNRLRKYSLRTSYSLALPDDEDLYYYVGEGGTLPTLGGDVNGLTPAQSAPFNNKEYAYFRKYTNWDFAETERTISPSTPRSGVNVRLIRLADVLLMYAECILMNDGSVDEALIYINRVRERSGLQLLGLDGTGEFPSNDHDNIVYTTGKTGTLMEHLIHKERPLELALEGNAIRHIDLRRWIENGALTNPDTKEVMTSLNQYFNYLASKEYTVSDYLYTTAEGKPGTKWGAVLEEAATGSGDLDFQEFHLSAGNFNPETHSYWPIPNSEITANPKLNEN